jgi:hypothetical protein
MKMNMRRLLVVSLFFTLAAFAMPITASAQFINITIAPPELPIYEQPPLPEPGYLWIPGYWDYGPEGYFWVPGTWVLPPTVGLLWTPGYWGWRDGYYAWNVGYWGPHVGFYGGVDYGFGYGGYGYEGGRWNNGVFAYNQTINNFGDVRVTNVYSQTVVTNTNVRVSFNGGNGGTQARPTPQEEAAAHEQHTPPTTQQTQHQQMASTNRALLASENHGHPAIAATAKPGEFSGKGVVAAREANPGSPRPGEPLTGARTPETNPTGARTLEPKPTGANTHEKNGPGGDRATLNGGTPPKPLNTVAKPLGNVPPPKVVRPNPPQPHVTMAPKPQPHMAAAPRPHPVAAPHPAARPGPPPKGKKPG